MKRLISFLAIAILFVGCTADSGDVEDILALRTKIENGSSYRFDASVTADYGDAISTFVLSCASDSAGNLKIAVVEPDTISGITCEISGGTGKIVFEDKLLAFELLADEMISPVGAPWVFMKALRSGYISSCGENEGSTFARIDDSYGQISYSVELWLDKNSKPTSAEIIWEGKRILSMQIYDFEIL